MVTRDFDKYISMPVYEAMKLSKDEQALYNQAWREKHIRDDIEFMVAVIKDSAEEIAKKYDLTPSGAYSALDLAVKLMRVEATNGVADRVAEKTFEVNVDNWVDTDGGETRGGVHYEG